MTGKYFSGTHLRMVERLLQPNVDYFLKSFWEEHLNEPCFIGKTGHPTWPKLTLTEEANKEPLKLVYNSDWSISFFAPSIGKWLKVDGGAYLIQQGIEGASQFEPLMTNENDGIVLRTVPFWEYLSIAGDDSAEPGSVKTSSDGYKAAKFKFLPVN